MESADVHVEPVEERRWKFSADDRGWIIWGHVELIDGRYLITDLHFETAGPLPEAGLTTDDLRNVRSSAIFDAVRWFATDTFDPEMVPPGSRVAEVIGHFQAHRDESKSEDQLAQDRRLRAEATQGQVSRGGSFRGDQMWRLVAEIRLAVEADPGRSKSVTESVADRLGEVLGREVPIPTVRTYTSRAAKAGWLEGLSRGRRGAMPGPRLIEARANDSEGGR